MGIANDVVLPRGVSGQRWRVLRGASSRSKRRVIALALSAFAGLPTTVVAQTTIDICSRTEEVRDAILKEVDATECASVAASRLAGITALSMSGKNIDAVASGDFDGLDALRRLDLHDNKLAALPQGIFDGLGALETLYLSRNGLATLPQGVFDDLAALETLYLYRNLLTTLPQGVFDELAALRTLSLAAMQLATLPAGVFDSLAALEGLWLNDNRLTSLPAGVFDNLTALETLDLHNNHLVGLARSDPLFSQLPSSADIRLGGQTPGSTTIAEPEQPEEPEQPDQPEEPDQPDQPDEPDQPEEPDQPDQPEEPDQPDQPEEPGQPEQPPAEQVAALQARVAELEAELERLQREDQTAALQARIAELEAEVRRLEAEAGLYRRTLIIPVQLSNDRYYKVYNNTTISDECTQFADNMKVSAGCSNSSTYMRVESDPVNLRCRGDNSGLDLWDDYDGSVVATVEWSCVAPQPRGRAGRVTKVVTINGVLTSCGATDTVLNAEVECTYP